MGSVIADLLIRVTSDVKDGIAGLDKAESKMSSVARGMRDVGTKMTAAITLLMLAIGKMSFDAASDMSEGMNAVEQVYGSAADTIIAWSKTTADSMGLAQGDALQTAAVLSAVGRAAGLTDAEMADFSMGLVARSADLASFYNAAGGTNEVLGAMQAALRGEFDPLERFGVILNADMVKAKALEMGLVDMNGEVTNQGKVLATNALIMEQSGAVAGDFERTQDGAANASRRLSANMKDLSAMLGAVLLPIGTSVLGWLNNLIKGWKEASPATLKVAVVIAAVVAAVGPLLILFGTLASSIAAISALFGGAVVAGGGMTASLVKQSLATNVTTASTQGLSVATKSMLGPVLAVIAVIALLALAYKTNFLGFADAVDFVARGVWAGMQAIWSAFQPVIDVFKTFFAAIGRVQSGSSAAEKVLARLPGPLRPIASFIGIVVRSLRLFNDALQNIGTGSDRFTKVLHQLPAPLQKMVILITRVRAAVRTFIRAWQEAGALAAFKTIPRSIELIGRTLGNLFQSVGLVQFGAAIKTVFENIGRVIGNVVDLVSSLIQGDWSQAWNDLQTLAQSAVTFFISQLTLLPSLIADVLDAIPWSAIGGAILSGLQTALSFVFTTAIPYVAARAVELFASIDWGAVADAIGDAGGWLITKGIELLTGLYNGAVGFLTGTVLPWLAAIGGTALAVIPDLVGYLLQKGVDLLSGLWSGISDYWPVVRDWFGSLPGRIAGLIPDDIGTRLAGAGRFLLRGLRDGVLEVWDGVIVPWFGNISSAIAVVLPDDMGTKLKIYGTMLITSFKSGIDTAWESVKTFFSTIVDTIVGWIPTDWGAVKSAFAPLTSILGDIIGGFEKIGGFLGITGGGGESSPTAPTEPPTTGVGTTQTITASFDGSGALGAIQTWATEVMAALAPVQAFFTVFGGAGVGTTASKTMNPPVFSGSNNLETVKWWADEAIGHFKRMNLVSAEQMRALLANTQIQFALIKSEATTKALAIRSAVASEFIGLRGDLSTIMGGVNSAVLNKLSSLQGSAKNYSVNTRADIANEWVGVRGDISQITGTIPDMVRGNLSFSLNGEGHSAGSSFGSGAYNGALGWAGALYDAGQALANSVVDGFNSVSRPGSPSRTAIYWASKIPQGVEYALNAGLPDVSRAGARLAGAAFGSASGSFGVSAVGASAMPLAASAVSNGKGGGDIHIGSIVVQGSHNGDPEETGKKIVGSLRQEWGRRV